MHTNVTTIFNDAMDTFRERLIHARKLRGLTQRGLAALVGASPSLISNAEDVHRNQQSMLNIVEIARALRVNVLWLKLGDGPVEESDSAAANQAGTSAVAASDILTLSPDELALIEAHRNGGDGVRALLKAAVGIATDHVNAQQRRRA